MNRGWLFSRAQRPLIRRLTGLLAVALWVGSGWLVCPGLSAAAKSETQEEKAANFKQQATGNLFQKWTFDQDRIPSLPNGFEPVASLGEPLATWMVAQHTAAPSPSNVLAGSSGCPQACYQLLLAKGLAYEYPDLTVRFRATNGAGTGGLVLGAHDAKNFYAAVVDTREGTAQLLRISEGQGTSLAQAPLNLKDVEWHTLRVQRNTIISKDFIEVYVDGTLVLSVEDQALGLGQVGFVLVGKSSMLFDSFHAVPLFSHRPLSSPPAY